MCSSTILKCLNFGFYFLLCERAGFCFQVGTTCHYHSQKRKTNRYHLREANASYPKQNDSLRQSLKFEFSISGGVLVLLTSALSLREIKKRKETTQKQQCTSDLLTSNLIVCKNLRFHLPNDIKAKEQRWRHTNRITQCFVLVTC